MRGSIRGMPTGGVLFEEDFDLPPAPPPPPEPEIIEPVYSASDLQDARAEAWREGHDAAIAEAEAASMRAARETLARIADHIDATRSEAAELVDRSAEAIARMLMDGFAAAFPALSRRHGSAELRAIVRTILPALQQELAVTVRLDGNHAGDVAREIEKLDPDLLPRIEVLPSNTVLPGDIRISWRNGAAIRDTAALWKEIEGILSPAGLLSSHTATKEFEHVE